MATSDSARPRHGGSRTDGRALDPLSGEALAKALDALDWSEAPCAGLGRVMARRDLDLAAALGVFFNGAPERFNYLPKPHVPENYRPVARHLDNICLRINSGFYLPLPAARITCGATLERWLGYQRADRQEGRCGRWVLSEAILAPLFHDDRHSAPQLRHPEPGRHGLWRALLAPLRGCK